MKRIIYSSQRAEGFQVTDIINMLSEAQENNYNLGISGLLIYGNDRFLQVIEGVRGPLTALYEKISKDDRHHSIHVHAEMEIENPSFDLWRMLFINLDTIGRGRGAGDIVKDFRPEDMSDTEAFDLLQNLGSFMQEESDHFIDQKKKISFCDDDPMMHKLMSLFLKDQPFELNMYSSAGELLDAYEGDRPDLVISDIEMPEMNGLELLREIRKRDFYVPLLLSTSKEIDEDLNRALANGADGYLHKPFTRSEMLTGIRQALLSAALVRSKAITW